MDNRYVKYGVIFSLSIILLGLVSCARVGRPTGGEKDEVPPIIINATPDFSSTNYDGEKIKISFNEYIKFEDLNQQLTISPPLDYTPEITPLGFPSKYITIKIKDTLKDNTTYTFNFGNAIVDNSEGNPLKQFKYLFSTGDFIDSLKVSGTIKDAFLKKPLTNISVLLYLADSTYNDSIIYKTKPNYIANTLDSIGFSITNVKKGNYHLLALEDINNNMLFDSKEDKIGFFDTIINVAKDTTYSIELFKEVPKFAIKTTTELSKNHIILAFEGLLKASIKAVKDKNKNKIEFHSYKDRVTDSLHIWHRGITTDSLVISVKQKDTVIDFVQRLRSKEIDSIQLSTNIKNTLHLRDSVYVLSSTPIINIDDTKIKLIDNDSIDIPFIITKDNIGDRFLVDFTKNHRKSYSLTLFPSAITDYFEQENDSILFSFKTKKTADYGEIKAVIKNEKETPVIVELTTESGIVLAKESLKTSKELTYVLLQPGKYILRAIYDENENQKWDTGNFVKRIQPERVLYHNKVIDVRANWTISEDFVIK